MAVKKRDDGRTAQVAERRFAEPLSSFEINKDQKQHFVEHVDNSNRSGKLTRWLAWFKSRAKRLY